MSFFTFSLYKTQNERIEYKFSVNYFFKQHRLISAYNSQKQRRVVANDVNKLIFSQRAAYRRHSVSLTNLQRLSFVILL